MFVIVFFVLFILTVWLVLDRVFSGPTTAMKYRDVYDKSVPPTWGGDRRRDVNYSHPNMKEF